MVPEYKIAQIDELHAQGMSQRKIAKAVGVSRNTVFYHLSGQRPNPRRNDLESASGGIVKFALNAKPKRCPTCGAKVKMPCLLCQLNELKQNAG